MYSIYQQKEPAKFTQRNTKRGKKINFMTWKYVGRDHMGEFTQAVESNKLRNNKKEGNKDRKYLQISELEHKTSLNK